MCPPVCCYYAPEQFVLVCVVIFLLLLLGGAWHSQVNANVFLGQNLWQVDGHCVMLCHWVLKALELEGEVLQWKVRNSNLSN